MKNDKLEKLILNGTISSYKYENISEDGEIGVESKFRNTEKLTIIFPNRETLSIDCFCSGSLENTTLTIQ